MEKLPEYVKQLNSKKTFAKGVEGLLTLVDEGDLNELETAAQRLLVVLQSRFSDPMYWSRGLEFFCGLHFRRPTEKTEKWMQISMEEVDDEARARMAKAKQQRKLEEDKKYNQGMFADRCTPITREELLTAFNLIEVDEGESRPAMSRDARAALPVVKAEKTEICPVCQEDIPEGGIAKKMPCNHLFHDACLMTWLEKANSCPTCRGSELPSEKVYTTDDARRAVQADTGNLYA